MADKRAGNFTDSLPAAWQVRGVTNLVFSRPHGPGYVILKKWLQYQAWLAPGRPRLFLLKTPDHLDFLAELQAVFPGARLVQTHRAPLESIASVASLNCTLMANFSDLIHPFEVGMSGLDWQEFAPVREATYLGVVIGTSFDSPYSRCPSRGGNSASAEREPGPGRAHC